MASRVYYYAEALPRTTTTTTNFSVSKTSVTFTPNASKTYAIFWVAIVDQATIGNKAIARLTNTTESVTFCTYSYQAQVSSPTTAKASLGGVALYTDDGTPVSQTIQLQVASSIGTSAAGFQEASILVLELVPGSDVWNSSTGASATTSVTYVDKVALSWTPASAGDYFVFGSAEMQPYSSGWDPQARMLSNGSPYNSSEVLQNESSSELVAYRGAVRSAGVSGAQTASLQFSSRTAGNSNTIESAYIVALRNDGFDRVFWAGDRTQHDSTSATYADTASVTGTPDPVAYVVIAVGMTTTADEGAGTATGQKINAAGTDVGTNFTQNRGWLYQWWTWFSFRKLTPAAVSQTWKTQYARTVGTAGSATSHEQVIAVFQLESAAFMPPVRPMLTHLAM